MLVIRADERGIGPRLGRRSHRAASADLAGPVSSKGRKPSARPEFTCAEIRERNWLPGRLNGFDGHRLPSAPRSCPASRDELRRTELPDPVTFSARFARDGRV